MIKLFERILLPVEGSEASQALARQGIELAGREHSQLLLLAVIDDAVRDTLARYTHRPPEAVQQDLESSAWRYLNHVAELARQAGVPVETRLRAGAAHREVLAEAQSSEASLILLGRGSEHGLRGLVMGRVLRQIITQSRCPVLILTEAE